MNGHDAKKLANRGYGRNASTLRAAKHGMANQMAHESRGRTIRNAATARLAAQKTEAVRRGVQRVRRDGKGMNAGTIGGARRTR